MMRLQKYMAQCGVASRRKCEEIIAMGLVRVNGSVVRTMGVIVEPGDVVVVDDVELKPIEKLYYVLYHKPMYEMCTANDPEGRPTVMDKFKDFQTRLFSVGRLDYDSEGLLLLTNDGELANRLMHPSFQIDKTYFARIVGDLSADAAKELREGVVLDGRKTSCADVKILRKDSLHTELNVRIHEGRNRQVRRMLDAVGCSVQYLRRIQFGPLSLGALQRGQWRELTGEEIANLKRFEQNA